jgi:hypothetical protein
MLVKVENAGECIILSLIHLEEVERLLHDIKIILIKKMLLNVQQVVNANVKKS